MLAQAHKGRAAARQSVHVLLSLEASASRAQAEREPSQHARCVYHNERRMQRRTSSAHTCFGSNACDAGSVPPAAGARGVVAYISLRVDVASSGGATGAPQHSSVILTAAPALHVSNLSPWPLRLHAISTPPPGSRPEPSLDPAAERVAAPRATLALPVLWAGGAGAAPAVLVSLAAPGVAGGTEHASAAAAVTGQADGAAADGGGPAGDRAPATCVPLLGAGAWAGRRRRLHVATGPGPCPAAAGGAAGAAPGAPAEAERARGAVVVTYRLLMPPGRAHLVLFRDAQPPLVLRNLCAVAMEVRAPRAWAGRSAEASPRHLAASSTLAVSWMPLCRQGPQGRRPQRTGAMTRQRGRQHVVPTAQVGVFLPSASEAAGLRYAAAPAQLFTVEPAGALECELPRGGAGGHGAPGGGGAAADATASEGLDEGLDEEEEEALVERLTAREPDPAPPPPVLRLRAASHCPSAGSAAAPSPRMPQVAPRPHACGDAGEAGGTRPGATEDAGCSDGGWSDPVALQPGSAILDGGRLRVHVSQRCATVHVEVAPSGDALPDSGTQASGGSARRLGREAASAARAASGAGGAAGPDGSAAAAMPLEVQLAVDCLQARSAAPLACPTPRPLPPSSFPFLQRRGGCSTCCVASRRRPSCMEADGWPTCRAMPAPPVLRGGAHAPAPSAAVLRSACSTC